MITSTAKKSSGNFSLYKITIPPILFYSHSPLIYKTYELICKTPYRRNIIVAHRFPPGVADLKFGSAACPGKLCRRISLGQL